MLLLMIRRPPRSTRTDTLFPYTTLFRSRPGNDAGAFLRRDRTARVEMDPLRGHGTVDEDVAIDRSQRGVASTVHRTGKVQRPGAGCRQLPGGDSAQRQRVGVPDLVCAAGEVHGTGEVVVRTGQGHVALARVHVRAEIGGARG